MVAAASRRRFWLAALMALALMLRAPGLPTSAFAAPGEGWIPICSGGGVVLVYVGDDAPPDGEAPVKSQTQPCAAFGLNHIAPPDKGWAALSLPPPAPPRLFLACALSASRPAAPFRSRAPPFPSV